jgi:hypothetical protein
MSQTLATNELSRNKKSKAQPVIVNPVFQECSTMTIDPFWISIFEKAAIGRYPRGFMFKNGTFTYKVKTKTYTLDIPENAEEVYKKTIDFMKKTAKLSSEIDRENDRQEIEEKTSSVTFEQTNWGDIKKKKIKNMLLSTYISKISKIHNFDRKQTETLKMNINVGFCLGFFNKNDIIFQNGEIIEIKGLIYDQTEKNYIIDPKRQPKAKKIAKTSETVEKPKLSFISLWNDFLDYYSCLQTKQI